MTLYTSYRRDLGDGLILRWSVAEDTERIAALLGRVYREKADESLNASAMRSIRGMMNGDYPLMEPDGFGLVEDTSRAGNPVVACTCLWKHTWTYEGIPFGVGRPEMVGTDDAYRNRGLIRALFEMLHERSEAEGDFVQAITGIHYFYRQFGYEYALELDERRTTLLVLIPRASEREPEPFMLREATVEDIPEIEALYNRRRVSSIVSERIAHNEWRYEIETWKAHPEFPHCMNLHMILNAAGQTVGFVGPATRRGGKSLHIYLLEFAEGVNVQAVMPPILRALHMYSLNVEVTRPDAPPLSELSFCLGSTHPVYEVLGDELARSKELPYAWYVRVKDLPAFLMHIAPALEKRLTTSPVAGYTGEMKLNFYRGGLHMVFEQGRLTVVEPWRAPASNSDAHGGFPPLVFLQVLFGHRSIEALRQAFPDVWVNDETLPVLKALFPTRTSFVFGW
jgi:GNAT superfamily N-acetyltransferase